MGGGEGIIALDDILTVHSGGAGGASSTDVVTIDDSDDWSEVEGL